MRNRRTWYRDGLRFGALEKAPRCNPGTLIILSPTHTASGSTDVHWTCVDEASETFTVSVDGTPVATGQTSPATVDFTSYAGTTVTLEVQSEQNMVVNDITVGITIPSALASITHITDSAGSDGRYKGGLSTVGTQILAFCGYDGSYLSSTARASVSDLTSWTAGSYGDAINGVYYGTADSKHVVAGGSDGSRKDTVSSCADGVNWFYNVDQLSVAQSDGMSCSYDGNLYMFAGPNNTSNYTNIVQKFDGTTVTTVRADGAANGFTACREGAVCVDENGHFWLFTGRTASSATTNELWKSTDLGATWTLISQTTPYTSRSLMVAWAIGTTLYVIAGRNSSGNEINTVEYSTDGGVNWDTRTITDAAWNSRVREGLMITSHPEGGAVLGFGRDDATYYSDIYRLV